MSLAPASTDSVLSNALVADTNTLGQLKMQAGKATPQAIRETAKQFESLFMRELMKSMREATMKSGMLDNPGSDLGTDLLDQQFAVQMSGQPGGLSDLIAAQLTRQSAGLLGAGAGPGAPGGVPLSQSSAAGAAMESASVAGASDSASTAATSALGSQAVQGNAARVPGPNSKQARFVRQHAQAANAVEAASGLPAGFMLGQAGHETGWGQHEIRMHGGAPSHNLFGIKAGPSWTGKVAVVSTTEYENGVAQKKVARFRAYDSYEESFRDYARLITQSPRYARVNMQKVSASAYASGLQRAGYATDPHYAASVSQAIHTTMQLRRIQT